MKIEGNKLIVDVIHYDTFDEDYVIVLGEVEVNKIYEKVSEDFGYVARVEIVPKSNKVVVEVYSQDFGEKFPFSKEVRSRVVWNGKEWTVEWTKKYENGRLVKKYTPSLRKR